MPDNSSSDHSSDPRTLLAARLWRAAERQAAEVEQRIAAGPRPVAEAERDARVLSVLAKTLRELSAVDAPAQDEEDEDAAPDDIEELRSALDERLRRLTLEKARPRDA